MTPLFFGCWNYPSHLLFRPGGGPGSGEEHKAEWFVDQFGSRRHIESFLAPWRLLSGVVSFKAAHPERQAVLGSELPQGRFLRHFLNNGYTALQWWDRCQGDIRMACNSTILMQGEHSSLDMIEALQQYFPHVCQNLERGGPDSALRHAWDKLPENQGRVELIEVQVGDQT